MKKMLFILSVMSLLLTGCNTIQGIGKDVEKLGEKVQDVGKK
jgi:predicted small secreted protein